MVLQRLKRGRKARWRRDSGGKKNRHHRKKEKKNRKDELVGVTVEGKKGREERMALPAGRGTENRGYECLGGVGG